MNSTIKRFLTSMILGAICAMVTYVPARLATRQAQNDNNACSPVVVAYLGDTQEGDMVQLATLEEQKVPLAAFPKESESEDATYGSVTLPNGTAYEGIATNGPTGVTLETDTATLVINEEDIAVYGQDTIEVYSVADCVLAMK